MTRVVFQELVLVATAAPCRPEEEQLLGDHGRQSAVTSDLTC